MPSLTIGEAALQLGVDANTLRKRAMRLRAAGKRCGQKQGHWWMYGKRDIARLQAAGRTVRE